MKLTNAQQADLETVTYFIPQNLSSIEITPDDVTMFFEYSERGLHHDKVNSANGFGALVQGKRWRGIHMQMYEDGILDGSMPYLVILDGMPRSVIEFMKKEMFKGKSAKVIEAVDQYLLGKTESILVALNN